MIEVSKAEILIAMRRENPWWSGSWQRSGEQPRWFLREVAALFASLEIRREIILLGQRRVGKTVLVHHLIGDLITGSNTAPETILYLQIDNPVYVGRSLAQLLEIYKEATGIDWRKTPCAIFFDEIQYLPDWEVHLKVLHDAGTQTRFLATGSASAALGRGSRESGAGRFTDFSLPPLTFAEYLHLQGDGGLMEKDEEGYYSTDLAELNLAFTRYINFGGYPEVALIEQSEETAARTMRSDIIDKVLLRDLPSLYGITDVRELNKLFTMLAFNSGHEISIDALSQKSAVSKNTIKRYLAYLEAAFLIRTVTRIDDNARTFMRDRTFRVYLTNPSLRTALFAPVDRDSEHYGHAIETTIFAQRFHRLGEQLHYARWKSGKTDLEIDLVEVDPAMRAREAIEIKSTDRIVKQQKAWDPWIRFCQKNGLRKLTVTTQTVEKVIDKEGIEITFEPAAIQAYRLVAEQFGK